MTDFAASSRRDQHLVGRADTFVQDLGRYRAMGFDHVMVRHIVGDHQLMLRSFERIGRDVMPQTSNASITGARACPLGVSRYHTSRWLAASRSTMPCPSKARRRALNHFGVMAVSVRRRSLNRRGPARRSRTTSSDHFSPITSRERAAGQKC